MRQLKPRHVAVGDENMAATLENSLTVGMSEDCQGHKVSFWGNKNVFKLF